MHVSQIGWLTSRRLDVKHQIDTGAYRAWQARFAAREQFTLRVVMLSATLQIMHLRINVCRTAATW